MWTRICYGVKDMPFNYSKFICDTEGDLSELPTNNVPSSTKPEIKPCAIGSEAIVVGNDGGRKFILNNNNEWKYFSLLNTATVLETKNYILGE